MGLRYQSDYELRIDGISDFNDDTVITDDAKNYEVNLKLYLDQQSIN